MSRDLVNLFRLSDTGNVPKGRLIPAQNDPVRPKLGVGAPLARVTLRHLLRLHAPKVGEEHLQTGRTCRYIHGRAI